MKTVIEMAQQTLNRDRLGFWAAGMGDLEAFVALVRADEREEMVAEAAKRGLAMKNEDPFEDYVRDIANDRERGST
jgi:hypothetical protein